MPVDCCPPNRLMQMFRRTSSTKPTKPSWQEWPRKPTQEGFEKEALKIQSVDPCIKRNGSSHHTAIYDLMLKPTTGLQHLVIRRGQPFELILKLNRTYNKDTDSISFIFRHELAKYPSVGRRTMAPVPLSNSDNNKDLKWSAVFDKSGDNYISVLITPSADTLIGKWKLEIDSTVKRQGSSIYHYDGFIYVLFNAWCKEDQVYMENALERKEYVMGEVGMMWRGSVKSPQASMWKYGQFDKDILDCSLMLLEKVSKLSLTQYNDIVMISRAISQAVNSPDDNGVVMGKWSTDYSGGTSPLAWIGSQKILRKYYTTQKPVKYGQCFVFAGVATTVFRALGIPSRPVTCYVSAHDSGCSLTLDKLIDSDGEFLSDFSQDSIWNYHVWNEIWTKRPDLNGNYDGWQVIDGTPQELSDNLYRCGPAPVVAVKNGEIQRPYDVGFVYGEVNADIIYWRYQGLTQPLKLIQTDTTRVGQCISTKAVGIFEREDITENYKYGEKSKEERLIMLNALRSSEDLLSRYYLNENFNDVKFEFHLQDDITIGSPYYIYLTAQNKSNKNHKITVILRTATQNSNGEIENIIKREEKEIELNAGKEEKVSMELQYSDYSPYLGTECIYHIAALSKVKDIDFDYFAQDDFRIVLPSIKIKLDETPVANQVLHGTACFSNPLPEKLKNCTFLVEGPGLNKGLKYKIDDVPPNAVAKINFKMTPQFYGKQTIVAKFNSNNLTGLDGYLTVEVEMASETNTVY